MNVLGGDRVVLRMDIDRPDLPTARRPTKLLKAHHSLGQRFCELRIGLHRLLQRELHPVLGPIAHLFGRFDQGLHGRIGTQLFGYHFLQPIEKPDQAVRTDPAERNMLRLPEPTP